MSASNGSSRRSLLRYMAGAPVAMFAFGVSAARGQEAEQPAAPVQEPTAPAQEPAAAPLLGQCVSDEDQGMRLSLNYVGLSPYGAEKDCRNCEFWIWGETAMACGGCTLIGGAIDPLGYCDSWALASAPAPPPA